MTIKRHWKQNFPIFGEVRRHRALPIGYAERVAVVSLNEDGKGLNVQTRIITVLARNKISVEPDQEGKSATQPETRILEGDQINTDLLGIHPYFGVREELFNEHAIEQQRGEYWDRIIIRYTPDKHESILPPQAKK
ncbi:MAG: hypothetical protein CO028_00040 [Candidatus Levybacteria bacterium CG_4_9_14_0_2_um_filter_35_21]|nr:MAG: hypothetical protein CO028_00040 [Candidatus Levybacteria bacterium CG_4_9_14_0_2_um_filter_35_21]